MKTLVNISQNLFYRPVSGYFNAEIDFNVLPNDKFDRDGFYNR